MHSDSRDPYEHWLSELLRDHEACAGTLHIHVRDGLELRAAVNIPEPVRKIVTWVPNGKGMAGLALQRGVPVQTCNLQDGGSSDVRPGARAVDARGAVAIPLRDAEGDIVAVVGLAFDDEREFDEETLDAMATEIGLPEKGPRR